MSAANAVWLLKKIAQTIPTASIGVAVPPGTANKVADILAEAKIGVALGPQPHLLDFVALVATADLVITPDTSVVHLASTFNIPQLALYIDPAPFSQWGPNSACAKSFLNPGSLAVLPEADIEAALRRFSEHGVVCD